MRLDPASDALKKTDISFSYTRIVKCGIALGDLVTAENAAAQAEQIQIGAVANELKSIAKLKQYEGEALKAYDDKDFRKVVYCMDRCLDEAPNCERYKLKKAECLAYLGRWVKNVWRVAG